MAFRGSFFQNKQHPGLYTFNSAGSGGSSIPFRVTNLKDNIVSVEPYSYLLEKWQVKNNIPICGLDYGFKLLYGEKVFLETVFTSTGDVAYAHIDREASWLTQKKGADGKAALVYPDSISVMAKTDSAFLTKFLNDQTTKLNQLASEDDQYWQDQITAAGTDKLVLKTATDKKTKHATNWAAAKAKLLTLQTTQSSFFSNVTSIRKQVASYNMLAYTTKNPDASNNLGGVSMTPPKSDQGEDETQGSDDIMKSPSYYLVQCLNKDLMLEDVDFNRTACRMPVEYSRPVYYFLDPDTNKEEDKEIVDSNSDNPISGGG